jgi:hypothetical protein
MHPHRLRNFLIGVGMFILGPALGFVLYVLLLMTVLQGLNRPATLSPEWFAEFQNFPGRILVALLPMGLGLLCGASGLVIVIANLAIHFLGQDPATTANVNLSPYRIPTPQSVDPAPPRQRSRDDSRYMPKLS